MLKDFSAKEGIDPEFALKMSNIRYSEISKDVFPFLIPAIEKINYPLPDLFLGFANGFHKILFKGIFSNAGKYRQSSDPIGGKIYFGPPYRGKSVEFEGILPINIERELKQSFHVLTQNDPDPVFTAIQLYQRFVYIHPFYDGKGRIGRLLVSIYLGYHSFVVLWKPLENEHKDKFIRLLNKCHRSSEKPHFEHKLRALYKFWRGFIKPLEALEIDETE